MCSNLDIFKIHKPRCVGCIYQGPTLPCEYILITGCSPKSQGAHIDPDGDGRCELYKGGDRDVRSRPLVLSDNKPALAAAPKTRNRASKLDNPIYFKMYKAGAHDHEIAEAAGMSADAVKSWRKRHGLKGNRKAGAGPIHDHEEFRRLYDAGLSDPEIARRTGASVTAVFSWRTRRGLQSNRSRASERERAALYV